MASPGNRNSNKEEGNGLSANDIAKETRSFVDKVLGDVGKSSATKQLVIGCLSGWCTGFITMKVGRVAAFTVGGSIILLQIANHQGYIKVNWDKVYKQVDKVTDKIEEQATNKGPNWKEKVERYVDRKIDKAEETLKRREQKARRWYNHFINGEEPYQIQEIHVFLVGFAAGVAIGLASGH